MSVVNVISAIGNNSSIYPLLVRDCGIEIPTKVILTYNQNKKDKQIAYLATRERIVDEYATSAVWLGGIPLLSRIGKKVLQKNGFNTDISYKLLKNGKNQGIDANIKKFAKTATEEVKNLEFLKNNKNKYTALLKYKGLSETAIPIITMGFIIPKLIFKWTALTKKQFDKQQENSNLQTDFMQLPQQKQNFQQMSKDTTSFKGFANFTTVQKMAITDGGYAVGRVVTERNRDAAIDVGFKMAGMLFLNFVFPKQLEKILNKSASKAAKTNLNLDIKMLADEQFAKDIKADKFKKINLKGEEEILNFIDKNPDNIFVQYAKKYQKVSFLKNNTRNPLKYVETGKLNQIWQNMVDFSEKASKSKDVDKFMKKAKFLKGANILANVGITSFLMAYALPKVQFLLRKQVLGLDFEPGICK